MDSQCYDELESNARELTTRHPTSGFAWKALGVALNLQHKHAVPALEKAAQLRPNDAEAQANLGLALLEAGSIDDAKGRFGRALELRPNCAETHNSLANTLRRLGRLEEAILSYQRALQAEPDHAQIHRNLGDTLLSVDRPAEAVASYRQALTLEPDYAEGHGGLGNALVALGRFGEAAASYRCALEIKPESPQLHNNLGNALLNLGRLEEAAAAYQWALRLEPRFAEAHNNLGVALRLRGRTIEARASCHRALAISPDSAAILVALADTYADAGQFAQAQDTLRQAIAAEPDSPEAWAGLAHLRKMTIEDTSWLTEALRIAQMHLPPRKAAQLHYAIGKYFDDVHDFDRAFTHYKRANDLTKAHRLKYEKQQATQAIDQLLRSYDGTWLERARMHGAASDRPVFIVGMPRSGSSLVEQILASHPGVHGAGELTFWGTRATTCQSGEFGNPHGDAVRAAAADYLRLLADSSADAARVIDKMPANFLHLGLIHAALPNARIIHMRRNPLDTCLSIYFQDFQAALPYANDLEDLAHYYCQYARVMDHWRSLIPPNVILEVSYEQLVEDPEAWSRRILAFAGLEWDPRCLDFHEASRTVVTASKWQVRQRISRSSLARWRNYEKHVEPLRHLTHLHTGGYADP